MLYHCNYDSTISPAPVSRLMQCLPGMEDVVKRRGSLGFNVPDKGVTKEFQDDQDMTPDMTEENVPDDELIDEEEAEPYHKKEGYFTKEQKKANEKMPGRCEACYTRRSLFVLATMLSCCVIFLVVAVVLRSMREEPGTGGGRADTTQYLLVEGEICEEHDECASGLCGGRQAPYSCQPVAKGCQPCHQDRNCFSGKCVLRRGQSVCASTADGKMRNGCLCDVDEECISSSCGGGFGHYTCNAASISCTVDTECPTGGVCRFGECSNSTTPPAGTTSSTRQSSGGRCSEDSDCVSRICVINSTGTDGVCSSGGVGSICATGFDCGTERCSQGLCAAKQFPGGACKANRECASGLCLGFTANYSGLCIDTSEANACEPMGENCGGSGKCVGGFCKSFSLMDGSVCIEDSDCFSDACVWSPLRSERICA